MIIKVPTRKPGTRSSFARLAAYISSDAAKEGEKVLYTHITNCCADEFDDAVLEIRATQEQNQTSKADKTYHLIVSFPLNERPSQAVLLDIEQELAASIGLGDHQRVSAVHDDTSHQHIHVAINKVHPESLRVVSPSWDRPKLQAAARVLEVKHGLTVLEPDVNKDKSSNKAKDYESQTHELSFNQWSKKALLAPLQDELKKKGASWDSVQRVLADNGLRIKPRGRGLIITTGNGRLYVKPSEIDRAFSRAALEKRLGVFSAATHRLKRCGYRSTPLNQTQAATRLYAAYQRYREDKDTQQELKALARRLYGGGYLRQKQALVDPVMAEYRKRQRRVWGDLLLSKQQKYRVSKRLKHQLRMQLAGLRKELASQRQAIRLQTVPLSWTEYLIQEAEHGNVEALQVLQSPKKSKAKEVGNYLAGMKPAQASDFANPERPIRVHKNSDLSYGVGDERFVVSDKSVHVFGQNQKVLEDALDYALQRHGRQLQIKGDRAFVLGIKRLAQKKNISVNTLAVER